MIKRTITQEVEKNNKQIVSKDIYIKKIYLFGVCIHKHEFRYSAKETEHNNKTGFQ